MSNEFIIPIKEERDEEGMGILSLLEETTRPAKKDHGLNENDEDLLRNLKKQEEKPSRHTEQNGQRVRTKIQKFPKIMRLRDETLIRPSEISIGPIHANITNLTKRKLKLRLATRFVAKSKQTAKFLLDRVKDDLDMIKKCFDKSVLTPYKDGRLARILFLDACSVLQFIHSSASSDLTEFEISIGLVNSIQKDLFLLENQLPFRLLKLLINSSAEKLELEKSIYLFVSMNVMSPSYNYWDRYNENLVNLRIFSDEAGEPAHLLDLLRSELLFPSDDDTDHEPITGKRWMKRRLNIFYLRSFRNVQDLRSAGIKFRPGESSTFRAVSFSKRWFFRGELSLPPIIVDNSTASKLWNLVAYEMCPDNYVCDYGVSSYLSLMDSLVDNEQDVRYLRANHVIRNRLSSDEEVARLFNSIGSNLVTDETYMYVKGQIQMHYESKSANWAAQVCQDHFSSPLKVFALFAAAVALLLTGISTWFAVYPPKDKPN